MRGYRVWSEIDLGLLRDNLFGLKKHLPQDTKVMAIVKADAYGHGAVAISNFCMSNGCDYLGVGDSTEALELRGSGITAPVLVLGATIEEELPQLIANGIELSVHSNELLPKIAEEAKKQSTSAIVHLKIDTGLHRFGISPQNSHALLESVLSLHNLKLKGIFSHFSSAYTDIEKTREEADRFIELVRNFRKKYGAKLKNIIFHLANSGGSIQLKETHLNMVRSGGLLFGLIGRQEFKQILTLKTQVVYFKKIYKNSRIGYNGTYKCNRDTLLAICPIGYNDGIPTCYSNLFETVIRGQKAKILGQVTMDYITIDVTDIRDIKIGDEVVMYDRINNSIYDVAKKFNLYRYELTCKLGKRIKRFYHDNNNQVYKRYVKAESVSERAVEVAKKTASA